MTLQNDEQNVTTATNALALDKESIGATIEADEAGVEAASVTASAAQLSLTEANLTSPIAGTVTAVNVAVGNPVSAGSTTLGSSSSSSSASTSEGSSSASTSSASSGAFEIVSTGTFEAQASITGSDVSESRRRSGSADPDRLRHANLWNRELDRDCCDGELRGGQLPGRRHGHWRSGRSVLGHERQRLDHRARPSECPHRAVQTAVHTLGTASFVYELKDGKEVEHTVQTGAVGTTLTQITSGLKSGRVVYGRSCRFRFQPVPRPRVGSGVVSPAPEGWAVAALGAVASVEAASADSAVAEMTEPTGSFPRVEVGEPTGRVPQISGEPTLVVRSPVIEMKQIWKTYRPGSLAVHALKDVASVSSGASSLR